MSFPLLCELLISGVLAQHSSVAFELCIRKNLYRGHSAQLPQYPNLGDLQRELYFNLEYIVYYAKLLSCTSLFLGSLMAHGEQRQNKLPAPCNEANTHDQRFPRIYKTLLTAKIQITNS